MNKWRPADVIALVALVGCLVLMALGINHIVTYSFSAIIAGYVGLDITLRRRK